MARANVNGIELHYEISGSGPTIVWLHGLMGSIARQRQPGEAGADIDALAKRGYRVVTYDARGHGESGYTQDNAHYTWASHAEDMRALLDALGIERATVGGGSMGAGVSVTFALAHPERVERLMLLAPPPLAGTIGTAQQTFGGLVTLIEKVGVEKAVEIVLGLPDYVALNESDPKRYAYMREWMAGIRGESAPFATRGLLFGPALAEERFAEITAPTLIVAHEGDPIHPASTAVKLHNAIAGSRLVVAPEPEYYRGHEGDLIEMVAEFLGKEPRRDRASALSGPLDDTAEAAGRT